MEKEVLGFYLTSHPLAEHEALLRTYCSHTAPQLAKLDHRTEVLVGGMLAAIKFSHTKNPRPGSTNTKYAMWDLEDLDGIMRCIMWPEQFAEFGELVEPDAILAIKGAVDRRPGAEEVNLIVNELIPLADLPGRFTSGISVRVREEEHGADGAGNAPRDRPRLSGHEAAEDPFVARRRRQRHDRLPELQRGDRPRIASPDRRPARPCEFQIHPRRPTHRPAATGKRPPAGIGARACLTRCCGYPSMDLDLQSPKQVRYHGIDAVRFTAPRPC